MANPAERAASPDATPRPAPAPAPTDVGFAATLPGAKADALLSPTLDGPPSDRAADARNTPSDLMLVAVPGAVPTPLQSWDRYEILRPLGQGGMGTVFLARDRKLGRSVALKFLRVPSPDAAERMMQEARAQARLDHGGICKVFEVGEFQGQPYIAMEYIDGQPLHTAMRRLTLEQRIFLIHQIALAVHAAHSQGILHRAFPARNSRRESSRWASWGRGVEKECARMWGAGFIST